MVVVRWEGGVYGGGRPDQIQIPKAVSGKDTLRKAVTVASALSTERPNRGLSKVSHGGKLLAQVRRTPLADSRFPTVTKIKETSGGVSGGRKAL